MVTWKRYSIVRFSNKNVLMDGLLISLIHNDVTRFDFLDYRFATAFLYVYLL